MTSYGPIYKISSKLEQMPTDPTDGFLYTFEITKFLHIMEYKSIVTLFRIIKETKTVQSVDFVAPAVRCVFFLI